MFWRVKLKVITNIWPGFLKNVLRQKLILSYSKFRLICSLIFFLILISAFFCQIKEHIKISTDRSNRLLYDCYLLSL